MPKAAKAFIIGVAVLFTLLIIWSLILYFPFTTKVDETYSGFEISLADPEYAQPCEVVINGKYKRYLVKPDFMGTYDSFEGDIVLPEPYKSELEGLELVSTAFTQNRMWLDYSNLFIWDREELTTIFPSDLYTRKNFDDVVIAMAETTNIIEYTGKLIVAPAESVEEAWAIFEEYRQDEKFSDLNIIAEKFENQ